MMPHWRCFYLPARRALMIMASPRDLLKLLSDHQVQYVLVGGMGCVIHCSQMVTQDVDICAPLDLDNLSRSHTALSACYFYAAASLGIMPLRSAAKLSFDRSVVWITS